MGLGGHAHGAYWERGVLDVDLHFLDLRIRRVLRRVVDRDAVVGHRDLAVEEGLVVVRVEPGQRARDESGVELLAVLERFDGFRAVDHDLVLLVDELGAESPDQPVAPHAVAGRVAEGHAAGRALGVQRLHHFQEVVRGLRKAVKAGRLQHAIAVDHHRAGRAERDGDPLLAVGAVEGLRGREPAAVLFAEVFAQVGDVKQFIGVEVGVVVGRQDDVRSCAGVGRDRRLGAHIFPALIVDAHLDAVLRAECSDVFHVLVDVTLHKAAPAQHAQLRALLGLAGPLLGLRLVHQGHRSGRPGGDTDGGFQKIPAFHHAHVFLLW